MEKFIHVTKFFHPLEPQTIYSLYLCVFSLLNDEKNVPRFCVKPFGPKVRVSAVLKFSFLLREPEMTPRLRLQNITKRYGSTIANRDISLEVMPGEILSVLGENGAGKSTLMKIIFGSVVPDQGQFFFNGKRVNISSPADARKLGIAMVFQHFVLFDTLTVKENILLGLPEGTSLAKLEKEIKEKSKHYGLEVDPNAVINDLSMGERQRVEILRALLTNPQLLILDEPTSVLSPLALKALFKTLRQLSSEGVSIIFITHKLNEIRALSKNCCVIRGGQVVANVNPQEISEDDLAKLMIGNDLPEILPKPEVKQALGLDLNLRGEKVSYKSHFPLSGQIHVPCGKIVGIAGISGNGQSDLMKAISGEALLPKDAILICGAPVGDLRVKHRRAMGLRYVPEERLGQATVPEMSLESNTLLTSNLFLAKGFMRNKMIHRFTETVIEKFKVKSGGSHAPAASLSGGNLQKFIVGRELLHNPKILVLNQPTWGVDAGAAALIRNALIRQRTGGSAVLVVSEELDELFEICDEIVVMSEGKISPQVKISDVSIEEIGRWMSGLWPQKSEAPKEASV